MKIFCDSADYKIIKDYNNDIHVKGFTTNPSLIHLSGAKNYKSYALKILNICKKKPISFEVFSDDVDKMYTQATKINSWGKNVYVKIPIVNTKGKFTGQIIKKLSKDGVKLNITAVYTYTQIKKILECLNKETKSIISIFAGRMADAGKDPIPIFKKSVELTSKYKNIEILWASTREAYNYLQAKKTGCQIITMPPKIIQTIKKFGKSYNKLTLDTVESFLKDARKSKFKI